MIQIQQVRRREKVKKVYEWIKSFKLKKNIKEVPGFQVMGTRSTEKVIDGVKQDFKHTPLVPVVG